MLLLTNDGDFAQKVTHPKFDVPKTYLVKVDGQPTPERLRKLMTGVSIIGGKVRALHVERIERGGDKNGWLKIIITEGKNRQIRQMLAKIGYDVIKLQRVAIGQLRMGTLRRGEFQILNDGDIQRIFKVYIPAEEREKQRRETSPKRKPAKALRVKKAKPSATKSNLFGD
jgi:23S rRNA pseudouridine2605 synthase